MVWQLLAKPLLGVATDAVKGFVETKKAKTEKSKKQKLKSKKVTLHLYPATAG